MKRVVGALVAIAAAWWVWPTAAAAAYTSIGHVQLIRGRMAGSRDPQALAAARRAFLAAERRRPGSPRVQAALAVTDTLAGDYRAAAERWATPGVLHSAAHVGFALEALRGADRPAALLDLYRRVEVPGLRAQYRAAAAAAAVHLAAEDPSRRADLLAESLATWPDNLCALAASAALGQEDAARRIGERRFDGADADDPTYRACVQRWATDVPQRSWWPEGCPVEVPGTSAPEVPVSTALPMGDGVMLTGAVAGACAAADRRVVWIRLSSAEGERVIAVPIPNTLRNGSFEQGAGVGPYVPLAFRRAGDFTPGFSLVRRDDGQALRFQATGEAAELRQDLGAVQPGDILLWIGDVRATVPTDPNRGVAVYAYWRTRRGQRAGFTSIMSGLSAHPAFRSFEVLTVVPANAAAADVAYSTTADVPVELDNVWVLNLTRAVQREAGGR